MANRANVIRRDLTDLQLVELSSLHSQIIPYSLNSMMGRSRIKNLYSDFLSSENSICLFFTSADGRIQAFMSGTFNYNESKKNALKKIEFSNVIHLFLRNKISDIYSAIIDTLQISKIISNVKGKKLVLTTWGALPNSGMEAVELFLRICDIGKKQGFELVVVDVLSDNTRLLNMYKRLNFNVISATKKSTILQKSL